MKPWHAILFGTAVFASTVLPARANTLTIDFDVDTTGQPIDAPAVFDTASPLTELYAPLGVHFAGAGVDQGGAILNDSTFTSRARSGHNFLAFSAVESTNFAGPESIAFDSAMSRVSIFASGLGHAMTFSMDAFDAGGKHLGSSSLVADGYSELSVSSAEGIRTVVLSVTNAGGNTYVFDDLAASPVPLPMPFAMFAAGCACLLRLRRNSLG